VPGPTNFTPGTLTLGAGAAEGICVFIEPCAVVAGVTIGAVILYENRDYVRAAYDKAITNIIREAQGDRCSIVRQEAIATCSDKFIGKGNNESPILTRACVRAKMAAQGCFNIDDLR
jgi:hypothetical protein